MDKEIPINVNFDPNNNLEKIDIPNIDETFSKVEDTSIKVVTSNDEGNNSEDSNKEETITEQSPKEGENKQDAKTYTSQIKEVNINLSEEEMIYIKKKERKNPQIIITLPSGATKKGNDILDQQESTESKFNADMKPNCKVMKVFHKFDITNIGHNKSFVSFCIKPKNGIPPNFYCPVSKCKFKATRFNSTIFIAQINDLTKPIGDYEIIIKVKNLDAPKQKKEIETKVDPIPMEVETESYEDSILIVNYSW